MALEQRQFTSPYIREHQIPETPKKQTKIRTSRKRISSGEKFLFVLFATVLVLFSTMTLHTQSQLNDVNREVQILEKDIGETMKKNKELAIEVNEKSTYEQVWEKAKALGLNLNEQNVKVVPER